MGEWRAQDRSLKALHLWTVRLGLKLVSIDFSK